MKFLGSQLSYMLEKRQSRRNLGALGRYLAALTGVIVLFAVAFHMIMLYEGKEYSWVTGFYWTLTVMSTLGFGDITFVSDLGRMFSLLVLLVGIIMLLIVLPFTFIRFFYAPWLEAQVRAQAPRKVPPNEEGHVLFTSWGPISQGLGRRFDLTGVPYHVIVPDPVRATELKVEGVPVVCGELDECATFEAARLHQARALFVNQDDATNTAVILTAREICPDVTIISLAENEESEDLLGLAGASRVLLLKQDLGEQLANRVEVANCSVHIIGSFEKLVIGEFPVHDTPYMGRTLAESGLRRETGVNVVGVWERGRLRPAQATTVLEEWSVPVVVGTEEQLAALDALVRNDELTNTHPVIVVGGGKVGHATAQALEEKGLKVHVVERDTVVAKKLEGKVTKVLLGESADLETLNRAGVRKAPSVVLSTNDDATNIYLSIYFRKLNPAVRIIARITHERNIESIHRAGADFALSYSSLGVESVLAEVQQREFVFLGGDAELFVLPVPGSLVGATLHTAGIGARTGLNVIGVRHGEVLVNPGADTKLANGATLLAIGSPEQRKAFKSAFEA